jgi:hypothetical protein
LMASTRDWYPLTRRSLAEPKNLRASAPIMPNSCICGSAKLPLAYQPIAHQLIVTHCGADLVREPSAK